MKTNECHTYIIYIYVCRTCSRRVFFVFQVDLRSATELGRDELIHGDIYEGFVNVGGGEHGGTGVWEGPAWDEAILEESNETASSGGAAAGLDRRKRRYFVSLIDESIYKKGVFQRLRRRHKVRVVCTTVLPFRVSERCEGGGGVGYNKRPSEARGFGDGRVDSQKPQTLTLFSLAMS